MNLQINIADSLTPVLRRISSRLSGAGATDLARAMGVEVQATTVAHLQELAASKHATASRLGATPSNHLAQAAEKVGASSALTTITGPENVAILALNHPGMARAFRDVTIVPKTAKALAIPIAAIAYNRRPAQLTQAGHDMFVIGGSKSGTGKAVLAEKQGDSIVPLYVLVRSVTQKQDRSLLPSDAELTDAAVRGVRGEIHRTLHLTGDL